MGQTRGSSKRQRGSIETLPSGSLRVKVYAGYDPISGRCHYLDEVVPAGPRAGAEAEKVRTRLLQAAGATESVPAAGLFILIGAEPFTNWLPDPVRRDPWGYVLTGPDLAQHWTMTRAPFLLETSLPGVFAVGVVRHGSVKRVASAVGEGSICIRLVHEYLALTP